jgi:hypothetical protein
MKIEGLDWIDMSSAVGAQKDELKAHIKASEREVRGAMAEANRPGCGAVEYYLTEDGTLIRLENAELCGPLGHANLLE